jgi:hypothetical protein
MKKLLTYCLLIFSLTAKGQHARFDPTKAYQNDTTGFTKYPDTFLLENLKLPVKYKRLEINTWVSLYTPKAYQHQHRNLYRYPAISHPTPDTMVLSKCDLLKCFTGNYGADLQPWYISAQTKKDQVVTIIDTSQLKAFLGKINNKFNAYLWLLHNDLTSGTPIKTEPRFQYKIVSGGFLIKYFTTADFGTYDDNDPPHHAGIEVIFFVGKDFRIVFVRKKNVHSNIIYKT